jgi:hypothetical protein
MTVTHNTFVEWPLEHRDIFEKFLTGMLADIERFRSAKASVGPYVLEMLQQQGVRLEAAKTGGEPAFDTRRESQDIIMSLHDNLKHLEKRAEAYQSKFEAPEKLFEALRDKEKNSWLTATGWSMLERAWDLGNVARGYHAKLPVRSRALRAVIILAMDAIKTTPSVEVLNYALESAWRGFWNYYTDYRKVVDTHGPLFLEAMKPVQNMVDLIAQGLAENEARAEAQRIAEEAAARRAAEEAEEAERRARWAEEDEEEQRQRGYAEPDTHQSGYRDDSDDSSANTYQSSYHNDSDDYFSNYNPATGMPTTSPYGWDVMGNSYGTTDHMF